MEVNVTDDADGAADCGAFFLCKLAMSFFFVFFSFLRSFVFAAMTFYLVLFAPYNEALTFL